MPWNWNPKSSQSVNVGGQIGTTENAHSTSTWPAYEAEYLARRLGSFKPSVAKLDRYAAGDTITDPVSKNVYLDKVTEGYKEEADEILKHEFKRWLEGTHPDNVKPQTFPVNAPGIANRKAITSQKSDGREILPGDTLTNWKPTWWGNRQLTHLDGVRDFLRGMEINAARNELDLNTLAEYGPQNLEEAWDYFKHWVKQMPATNTTRIGGTMSDIGGLKTRVIPNPYLKQPRSDYYARRSGPHFMDLNDQRLRGQAASPVKTEANAVDLLVDYLMPPEASASASSEEPMPDQEVKLSRQMTSIIRSNAEGKKARSSGDEFENGKPPGFYTFTPGPNKKKWLNYQRLARPALPPRADGGSSSGVIKVEVPASSAVQIDEMQMDEYGRQIISEDMIFDDEARGATTSNSIDPWTEFRTVEQITSTPNIQAAANAANAARAATELSVANFEIWVANNRLESQRRAEQSEAVIRLAQSKRTSSQVKDAAPWEEREENGNKNFRPGSPGPPGPSLTVTREVEFIPSNDARSASAGFMQIGGLGIGGDGFT